jgi:hypothetical protein
LKRSITVIISLTFLILIAVGCNNIQSIEEKEKETTRNVTIEKETILSLISSEKWDEAKLNLAKPEFKDIENYHEIFAYVDAKNDYENEKGSGKISYEPIVMKLNLIDLDTYHGVLKEDIEKFKITLIEEKESFYKAFYAGKKEESRKMQEKQENDKINKLIEEKEYDQLSLLLVLRIDDDIDSKMLFNYANSQQKRIEGDSRMMMSYLESIPSTYNGKYADLISKEKLKIQSKDKWLIAERKRAVQESKWEEIKSKIPPALGMTASEVRDSSWGGPDKINKTTYEFGVHEQWVYSNYRYVYFEDGIVTTIQE